MLLVILESVTPSIVRLVAVRLSTTRLEYVPIAATIAFPLIFEKVPSVMTILLTVKFEYVPFDDVMNSEAKPLEPKAILYPDEQKETGASKNTGSVNRVLSVPKRAPGRISEGRSAGVSRIGSFSWEQSQIIHGNVIP